MNGKVIIEILFAELQIKFGYKKYFFGFRTWQSQNSNQSFMHHDDRNRANQRILRYSYKFVDFHDER